MRRIAKRVVEATASHLMHWVLRQAGGELLEVDPVVKAAPSGRKAPILDWLEAAANRVGVEVVAADFDASRGRGGVGMGLLPALNSLLDRPRSLVLVGICTAEELLSHPDCTDLHGFLDLSCVRYLQLPFDSAALEAAASEVRSVPVNQVEAEQLRDVLVRLQMRAIKQNVSHAITNATAALFCDWVESLAEYRGDGDAASDGGVTPSEVPRNYHSRLRMALKCLSASILALEARRAPQKILEVLRNQEDSLSEASEFASKLVDFEQNRYSSDCDSAARANAAEWGRCVLARKSTVERTLLKVCSEI